MMGKLILLIVSVGIFFVFIGCVNRAGIEKARSECGGYLMMLYSGCHCFKELNNGETAIVPVNIKERYCHD